VRTYNEGDFCSLSTTPHELEGDEVSSRVLLDQLNVSSADNTREIHGSDQFPTFVDGRFCLSWPFRSITF
jgi:hypothetical protein